MLYGISIIALSNNLTYSTSTKKERNKKKKKKKRPEQQSPHSQKSKERETHFYSMQLRYYPSLHLPPITNFPFPFPVEYQTHPSTEKVPNPTKPNQPANPNLFNHLKNPGRKRKSSELSNSFHESDRSGSHARPNQIKSNQITLREGIIL